MRKIILFIISSFTFLYAQQPGDLVSSELKLDVSPGGLINWIDENTDDEVNQDLIDFIENVPFGLQGYKLTYKSQDYNDNLVNATGLILFPKTNRKLSTVLYMSPTTDTREDVPSNLKGPGGIGFALPIFITMAEYIVVAPDYLGMSDGDGVLAYMEDKTAAAAGLDMLTAANQFLDNFGKERYNEYFVGGYSQGGHSAMSVVKANQEQGFPFPIKYLAAGAGPYDMSNTTMKVGIFDVDSYPRTALLAYVINTCENIGFRQTRDNWHDVVSDEYYEIFETTVLRNQGGTDWGPEQWREMVQPAFAQSLTSDNNHPAIQCLRSNDVYDFYNKTPTTMFSSWFDKTIPPENDKLTKDTQRDYYRKWDLAKYKIRTNTLGPWNHLIGSIPYTLAAIYKFNTKRKGGFFNSFASYTGEYNRISNKNVNLEFVNSTIAPEVLGDNESFGQRDIYTKKSFKDIKELKKIEEQVSLVKVRLANGDIKVFPFLKEQASELDAKDILSFDEQNMKVDMANWPSEIESIHLIKDKEIIYTMEGINGQKYYTIELSNIPAFDMVEIIADAATFIVKTPLNNIFNAESMKVVKMGNMTQVLANKSIKRINAYNMSGGLVKSIESNTDKQVEFFLEEGIYIIQCFYENGTVESKKFIRK